MKEASDYLDEQLPWQSGSRSSVRVKSVKRHHYRAPIAYSGIKHGPSSVDDPPLECEAHFLALPPGEPLRHGLSLFQSCPANLFPCDQGTHANPHSGSVLHDDAQPYSGLFEKVGSLLVSCVHVTGPSLEDAVVYPQLPNIFCQECLPLLVFRRVPNVQEFLGF